MKKFGIATVYYSDENGEIVKEKVKDMEGGYKSWRQEELKELVMR